LILGLEFICRSENKALEIWIGTFGIEIDHVFYYGNTVRCWTGCWKVLSTSLHWREKSDAGLWHAHGI